ncbi:MAG: hypothetical protein HY268_28185, partial [Deltaproteobacteria bacterium]|nr:hypothetical protein [Deltaproteobacteria bacterium]
EERTRYLDALEAADRSDLGPLVSVFAAAQRKAFVQVLSISGQVLQLKRAEQVIAATRNQLESRDRTTRAVWDNAKRTAGKLQNLTNERFKEIARSLEDQTGDYLRDARFMTESEPAGGIRSHYFRWQIVETARRIGYFANTNEYHAWTRLILRAGSQAEILVSFHGTGSEFRGILAVSACFCRREATDEGERAVVDLVPLTLELFQINYREDESNATVRFENWLEEILVKGLELWRQSL